MRILPLLASGCFLLASVPAIADSKAPVDQAGDALPEGAAARLGTLRFRTGAPESQFSTTWVSADGKRVFKVGTSNQVQVLDALTGKEIRTVKLEKSVGTFGAVVSEDGAKLASYFGGRELQIFDLDSGKELLKLSDLTNYRIDSLQLSADGSIVSMVNAQNPKKPVIHIWETKDGKKVGSLEPMHDSSVQTLLSQDGKRLVSWCGRRFPAGIDTKEDQEIRRTLEVWDVESGKSTRLVTENLQTSRAIISADGKRLLAADSNSNFGMSLFSLETGKLERHFATRMGLGTVLAFAPDGKTFAAGSFTGLVQVWETETGKRLESCERPGCRLTRLIFDAKAKVHAFGLDCSTTRTWEVSSANVDEPLAGHTGPINALCFLGGGKQIATSGQDARILIWDAKTHELVKQIDCLADSPGSRAGFLSPTSAEFSSDGKYLVSANRGSYAVYDVSSGKVQFHLPVNLIGPRPALASAKGLVALPFSKAIPGGAEGHVGIWNLDTGEQIHQLKVPWPVVSSIALSPDGETLVCAHTSYDNTAQPPGNVLEITSWNLASGKEKFSFKMPAATQGGMTFSPDGRALVVGVQSGLLWVSDMGESDGGARRKLVQVPDNGLVMGTPVFAPDGRSLAIVRQHAKPEGLEYRIEIWETASRTLRRDFTGHKANVNAVAFSPDGFTLASGSNDTTSLLWDLWAAADQKAAVRLEAKELTQLWDNLNSPNADSAWEAQQRLALGRDTSLPYLGEHLQAGGAEPPSKEQIAQWIKQLDDDNVETREKAGTRLLEAGKSAKDALTKALDGNPSAEASQRIKQILDKLADGDQAAAMLRPLRALEVLEHIGTPEAKEIIKKLADGKADSGLTIAAKESLKRWR